jgi:hypothetical protein
LAGAAQAPRRLIQPNKSIARTASQRTLRHTRIIENRRHNLRALSEPRPRTIEERIAVGDRNAAGAHGSKLSPSRQRLKHAALRKRLLDGIAAWRDKDDIGIGLTRAA